MKVAIIGSGISGLGCAHRLAALRHNVAVFEASDRIGGHTATYDVKLGARRYAIDTGFIVYNDHTYPNFIELLESLGVATRATAMGFSVSDDTTGLEYAGNNLNTLFAQRRNLVSPKFLSMVRDILRFNKESVADLDAGLLATGESLGCYLERQRYSEAFCKDYLLAMTSAIWSADFSDARDFPVEFFIRFFRNHGLLQVANRPQWRVIEGGSREYIPPLTFGFEDRIFLNHPVQRVERTPGRGVQLQFKNGLRRQFDQVVIATHSDQALAMLADPSAKEQAILGAIPYRDNDVVLHTDDRVLPRNRKTWSSWNYRMRPGNDRAVVTYNMNILQGIQAPETFCVTLNDTDSINPARILGRFNYAHPQFTVAGVEAQGRWEEINGVNNTWFCGAYWRNGFHEDGLVSGLRVAEALAETDSMAA
ncbi:NAD(P)/FAD-dependent oxidoreductase [Luminiphilus sp. nBUS_16]|uniref:NAD(P)/FAD-dependent oxidoreductase n=1 Tax=Luminiphilus sp. nBUS_16 TaxID=3395315 RepID=UPI003EBBBF25